jgi:hypothetical protein
MDCRNAAAVEHFRLARCSCPPNQRAGLNLRARLLVKNTNSGGEEQELKNTRLQALALNHSPD